MLPRFLPIPQECALPFLTALFDALVLVLLLLLLLLLLLFTIYRTLMKIPVANDYDNLCYPSSLAHVAQAFQLCR